MDRAAWVGIVDDLRTTAQAIREMHVLMMHTDLVNVDCLPLVLDDRLERIGQRADAFLRSIGQGDS